jgi:hypothetical protein
MTLSFLRLTPLSSSSDLPGGEKLLEKNEEDCLPSPEETEEKSTGKILLPKLPSLNINNIDVLLSFEKRIALDAIANWKKLLPSLFSLVDEGN